MPKRSRIKDFLWRHSAGIAFLVMVVFVGFIGFVGYTYVVITKKFDSSRRWDLPSRIYSDATAIVPGMSVPRVLLEPKLNHVGYHEVRARVANPGDYRYVNGDLEIYLQNFEYPDVEFRAMPVLIGMDGTVVRDVKRADDGVTLRGIRIEPELITSIYNNEMEDRLPIALGAVPKTLTDAIIAIEDKTFYSHNGISLRGIAGALRTDIKQGNIMHGGSTLTQQLVKNLYRNPERAWNRKITEALRAVLLEMRYRKAEILEAYVNEIYLGQNGAVQIIGVEQASQVYFGKHVTYLTLPEAATLAGIIHSPNVDNPLKYLERAKPRRDLVLHEMRDQGLITPEQYEAAVASPLTTSRFPKGSRSAPFFVDLVLKQLRETYPETQLKTEGLRIFTTLDTIMQRSAEQALDSGIDALTRRYSYIKRSQTPLEGVILTIQPGTGYVKALVGGRNYSKTQFNRAIQARRQPGSLFKPFVYVTAMDPARGQQAFTAATVLDDSPITVRTGSNVWEPQNYDQRFHGRVTVRDALAHSYNIPAVRAAIDAGVPNVIKTATTIGIESTPAAVSIRVARRVRGDAAGDCLRLLCVREPGGEGGADLDPGGVDARRQAAGVARGEDEARRAGQRLLRDERRAEGRLQLRHGREGPYARLRSRLRRQDGDDEQLPRCLVHRLLAPHPHPGLGRLRRRAQRSPRRRRRLRADLDLAHEPHRRHGAGRRLEASRRHHRPPDRSRLGNAGHGLLPADKE